MLKISHPTGKISGKVLLPASKSIANRLLLMRAVSGFNDLPIANLSNARDTVILDGLLKNFRKQDVMDVHDAGTVMRFMTAFLAGTDGEWTITGSERMQQRPIGELVDVLRVLGANISYTGREGYPPLKIRGTRLQGGKVEINAGISSQFISALLMIAPLYRKSLELIIKGNAVSESYIKMTIGLMSDWGVKCEWKNNSITVQNTKYRIPTEKIFVESDWSAASYFFSLIALCEEGELTMPHLLKNSLQGDSACIEIFERLGVKSEFSEKGLHLRKQPRDINTFEYDFITCPDIAQTVAVCCAAKGIEARLTGLQTLSIKETDRIQALKKELAKIGVSIEVSADQIYIPRSSSFSHSSSPEFSTYNDHRMAMSLAPLALGNEIGIEDPQVVEKSFPYFWEELKNLGFQLQEM